ncbi:MAG: sigma-70 family RNA polymerase sigma factor [Cyclobacteriaceae bacterium]|nr:sigma-70 family RNA polymerase sigma factor [Cyclobacteriaceae bacterium]
MENNIISNNISDVRLILLYKHGNEEGFSKLVNRHKARIYTVIYLIVKDKFVAEDILQEVFMKVVTHVKTGKYDERGKFLPWVLRIAHNMAIDHFRKVKRRPEVVFEDGNSVINSLNFSEDDAETEQIRKDINARVRDLIKRLPDNQRQVLIMRHYIGMSFQEIADKTGVSINTALGRMRYALINLRKELTKHKIAYDKNFYPE